MDPSDKKDKDDNKEEKKWFTIKNPTDLQRVRLEKLMKNPVNNPFKMSEYPFKSIVFPSRARRS